MKNDVQKSSSLLRPKLDIIHIYDISNEPNDHSSNRHRTYRYQICTIEWLNECMHALSFIVQLPNSQWDKMQTTENQLEYSRVRVNDSQEVLSVLHHLEIAYKENR